MLVTIYENAFAKDPHYIPVLTALNRIQQGKSQAKVLEIRSTIDEERQNKMKMNLPSVCFSGEFKERTDKGLQKHSSLVILDFDKVEVQKTKDMLKQKDFIFACWTSPRNNGVKALVKIADPTKHAEHFDALLEAFPQLDQSGRNISRLCFESFDPEIYINESAKVFTKIKKQVKEVQKSAINDNNEVFEKILKWLSNKGDAFVKGERNFFMFKLASACCRFGLLEHEAFSMCASHFLVEDNTFSSSELRTTIASAYKRNSTAFGSAKFELDQLVDVITRKEIEVNADMLDPSIKPKDVIFGEDVKHEAMKIFDHGHAQVKGVGVYKLDNHFKMKKGEITLLSGIGNYGKSSFLKWYLVVRILKFNEKFCLFAPEDFPCEEFFHDMTEILLGADCTPQNKKRPTRQIYERAFDKISKHIFYVYPETLSPSPDYIKERFLEMIIKEKVDGCIIDPFNQMTNDYSKAGGRSDKYLETFLSDCSRFAQTNKVYFLIVAHPHKLRKDADGNYPCPDVFEIADGSMWNNKMDNILIYHRPNHQNDPSSTVCELHTKKIRKQKTVGKKGVVEFELDFNKRRYLFDGQDILEQMTENKQTEFKMTPNMDFDPTDINDATVLNTAPF